MVAVEAVPKSGGDVDGGFNGEGGGIGRFLAMAAKQHGQFHHHYQYYQETATIETATSGSYLNIAATAATAATAA